MKKVIIAEPVRLETTTIDKLNRCKIYLCKTSTNLYKLHCITSEWGFVSLGSSFLTSCGTYPTANAAVEAQMEYGDVYEFDTLKEAMEEML